MTKRLVALALSVLLIFAFAACNSGGASTPAAGSDAPAQSTAPDSAGGDDAAAAGGEKNIVFIPKGVADFWTIVSGGFEQAAKDAGMTCTVTYPDQEEATRQVETMYDVINSNPDAIVLSPISPEALAVPCKEAMDKGIPVVLVDTLIATDDYVNAFMTDNEVAGAMAAEEMAKLLDSKGKVHIFAGSPDSSSNAGRIKGFTEYMESNCPDIEVLGVLYSEADIALATTQTVDIMTANPDLAGIFAVDENRSSGCSAALQQLKREDMVLAGFDANENTVALMEEGVINFMTVQQPFMMGYMGFESALKAANGEEQPHEVLDTGCTVVTQDNMDEEEMQKILFPLKFL